MTEQEFIEFVNKECEYYGVKCQIRNGKYIVYQGFRCGGVFDDKNLVLAAAKKHEIFLAVFAHEYCHLTQWVEKAPVWIKANEFKSYEAWDEFLKGAKIDMDHHFDIMRDIELDNEKRTVKLIKRLKLPIDIRDYTKKANAYVMFYNYMKLTGRWCNGRPPYTVERILDLMPDKFSMDYSKLPKRIETAFKEAGF